MILPTDNWKDWLTHFLLFSGSFAFPEKTCVFADKFRP